MAAPLVFWLDEGYDREHAPDHVSRYGAEVRERSGEFAGTWDDISPVPSLRWSGNSTTCSPR